MRAWYGKYLLGVWSSLKTPRCYMALDTNNARIKFCSGKPVQITNIIKKVKPFGKIIIDLHYDVEIKPTDPHEYPDMDTILIKLLSEESSPIDDKLKDDLISVHVTDDVCQVKNIERNDTLKNVRCLIQTPVRYDVDVKTIHDANVHVNGMISDSINVQTEFGNIVGSKLKGKQIILSSSEGGSVTLQQSIQGDIEINTAKDGFVDAEKCLGTKLDISTENGYVKLGSTYCEKATFTTLDGNLNLNNLHMDSTIDIHGKGSLNISCLDGSLQANIAEGPTQIQLARITQDSNINSAGDVTLTIPENLSSTLIFRAPTLVLDKKIDGKYDKDKKEFIGKKRGMYFTVGSNTKIQVKQASWMETFKFENTPK